MARKNDAAETRTAAAGRWREILINVGGVPSESLDASREHPCPKCQGDTRFRFINEERGAVFCSHCGNKNGDGLASVQWLLNSDFPTAVAKVRTYLGLSANGNGETSKDPGKDLVWMPWNSELADFWIRSKTPITEQAVIANGGRLARYKDNYTVIAWPIIGESLDVEQPVGYLLVNAMGGALPRWDKSGKIVEWVDKKLTAYSKPGLLGTWGITRIKVQGLVEICWKVEGITDLLVLWDMVPEAKQERHVAIANSNGAMQKPGPWLAALAKLPAAMVLQDCDAPGQTGAAVWCQELAKQGGRPRNVVLPYEVTETHGKDLRDWRTDGHDYADLTCLAEQSAMITSDDNKPANHLQELILKRLQIEVLYEDADGRIRVHSWHLNKSSWLPAGSIDRVSKARMVQMYGQPALDTISADPDGETTFGIGDVRQAIALMASGRREEHAERGVGFWRGQDERGRETDSLVYVGESEAAILANGVLERATTARRNGLVLDLGSGHRSWYDFELLEKYIKQATDQEFVKATLEQLYEILGMWNWKNELAPHVVAGLIMATWVQTIWAWRPLVAIVGESNSGKSSLFDLLGGNLGQQGIFSYLAFKCGRSTSEPGMRQAIGNTGKVVLCDEFEKSQHRDQILETLRGSSRGDTVLKGSSGGQRGVAFTIRHLVWIAATESGLHRQPDINRFIQLELDLAKTGKTGELLPPLGDVAQTLGQKLLAIATANALAARQMAIDLKKTRVEGVDARTVEIYAVPASMLATAQDWGIGQATEMLSKILRSLDKAEQGSSDQEELLGDILAGQVHCGASAGLLTVAQLIEPMGDAFGSLYFDHAMKLAACGVDVEINKETGHRWLFVAHRQVRAKLLSRSQWEGQRIDQLLMRLPGAERRRVTMAAVQRRCICIPLT